MHDKELVKKAGEGDLEAFQILIKNYQQLVAHIVFRMVPNYSDREDICQDVFFRVYNGLESFRFQCKLSTWIARIAYNRCINYLQKKKVVLFDDETPADVSFQESAGTDNDPYHDVNRNDLNDIIRASIDLLPAQFRALVSLFHLEEMSYQEISEITGLPMGTVKSYLYRARKMLKEYLSARYSKEELLF